MIFIIFYMSRGWHGGAPVSAHVENYRKTCNIRPTLVGNKIGDHSDVVGAAPTTSSFST